MRRFLSETVRLNGVSAGDVLVSPTAARLIVLIGWLIGVANPIAAQRQNTNLRAAKDSFSIAKPLSTQVVSLPPDSVPAGSGFRAMVELSEQFSVGYADISIQLVSSAGPLTADRNLTLRITPTERHVPADEVVEVKIPLTFPQGKSRHTLQTAFPKWTLGNTFRLEILEEGSVLPDYVTDVGMRFPGFATQSPAATLSREMLFDIAFIDTQPTLVLPPQSIPVYSDNQALLYQTFRLDELPADWRLLRDFDCLVLPHTSIEGQVDTPGIQAIRRWLMMGGVLVVVGESPPQAVFDALQIGTVPIPQERNVIPKLLAIESGQQTERTQQYRDWLRDVYERQLLNASQQLASGTGADATSTSEKTLPIADQIGFAHKWITEVDEETRLFAQRWRNAVPNEIGNGYVFCVPSGAMNSSHAFFMLERFAGFRRSAILRRGVEPLMGDRRSREWLIPGVAQPPVYAFIGSLTLFVLLVGPIAYRWTTRSGRSHLMFLIAPTLAILTTVAMFAYSIVADGFSTAARVRQLTWVDGVSGDAVERTRVTLFSGISPWEGLTFPADAEVMRYPESKSRTWDELPGRVQDVRLKMSVSDEAQHLDNSFLPSRTQCQFVSHLARPGLGWLQLTDIPEFNTSGAPEDNKRHAKFVSTFPFELHTVIGRSLDQRYWYARKMDADSEQTAIWIDDAGVVSATLGQMYLDHRLVAENQGVTRRGRRPATGAVTDLSVFFSRDTGGSGEQDRMGVFENSLVQWLRVGGDLPPGTFIAFSEVTRDTIPVKDADVVSSVRYVMGTLR